MATIVEREREEPSELGPPKRRVGVWLVLVGVVIMLAGALFGYDQGVISGALEGIQNEFDLSTTLVEIITSWVTLGALFGALLAGLLADRMGRRRTILVGAVLFCVGAMLEACAPGTAVLVVGRFTVGFAVGVASVAAIVIYIAYMIVFMVLWRLPFVGWIAGIFGTLGWAILALGMLGLWLFCMFKAFQGERFKLPYIGEVAEKQVWPSERV